MDLYKVRQELMLGKQITNVPLRVTYYSRVSTDSKEQINSLTNQENHFKEMINNNKNWIYIDGYKDEGLSGTSSQKRNNFIKMINDAKENKFDLIITKEISRFSRNTLDSIKYTRELLSYGVGVLFFNDNINTILPDSELRLTLMSSLAQEEIRKLSDRVKFGMHESIKKGNILGNQKLYGYKKDKVLNKYIVNKRQASIIKEIYELYANHNKTLRDIIKILDSRNIKTINNKNFSPSSLSRLIKNPKYKGYYVGRKSEVIDYITRRVKQLPKEEWIIYKEENIVPSIVSEDLWNKANIRLNKRKKFD